MIPLEPARGAEMSGAISVPPNRTLNRARLRCIMIGESKALRAGVRMKRGVALCNFPAPAGLGQVPSDMWCHLHATAIGSICRPAMCLGAKGC